jgi:secondary thiamine-phosphate synthase enzyme
MRSMWAQTFEVETGDQPAVVDLTDRVNGLIRGLGDGLLHVFLPHATAGLALIETGSGSEADLLDRLESLLPRDRHYRHQHGAPGHGRDHLLPALISPAIVLAVRGGRLDLGVWQSLVLVDTNVDNRSREVRLSFLAG